MVEKKPVYNGYDEKYLSGAELKEMLNNRYYSTGRHHSTIMGLTIPEYLSLIGIRDETQYRIFINENFCRVMNGETDGLIAFFGHTGTDHISFCTEKYNPVETKCPVCGASMKLKKGRYGEFLGCSKYPACKYTSNIPIIGEYQM